MEELEWECPCCTLKNSPKEVTCEECGTRRGNNNNNNSATTATPPNNLVVPTGVVATQGDLSAKLKEEDGGGGLDWGSVLVGDVKPKQESATVVGLPTTATATAAASATLCQPASAHPASYGDEVEVFEFDGDDGDDGEVAVVFAYADRETAISSDPASSFQKKKKEEEEKEEEEEEGSESESDSEGDGGSSGVVARQRRGRPKKSNSGRELLASSRGVQMHQAQMNGASTYVSPDTGERTRSNRMEVLLRIKQTLGRDDTIPIAPPVTTSTTTTPTTTTTSTTTPSRGKKGRLGRSGDGPAWPDKVAAVLIAHGGKGTGPEIRNWVGQTFPEVKERAGWENAVRSCLSNSKRIRKGGIDPVSGYALWYLKKENEEDKDDSEDSDGSSSSSSSSSSSASSSSSSSSESEGRRRKRKRGRRTSRRTSSSKRESSSEYDSEDEGELKVEEEDSDEDRDFTSSSTSSSSEDEDEENSSEEENFRKKKRKKEEDEEEEYSDQEDVKKKKKRVIKKDDTTWPEKIDFVLRQHGGGGTSEEICNWIEESFPQSIAGRANWRRTISASLSVDPGFVKGPPRPGEKGSVWTLYTRQPGKLSQPNSNTPLRPLSSSASFIPTPSSTTGGQPSLSSSLESSRPRIQQDQTKEESKEKQQSRGEEREKEKRKDRKKRNWSLTSSKIAKVMNENGGGKGRLCDICDWVKAAFPEDIEGVDNWRNRISNYLSHNTMFEKSDDYPAVWSLKEGVTGKGAWTKRNKRKSGDGEVEREAEEEGGERSERKVKKIKREEKVKEREEGVTVKPEKEKERKLVITSEGETWPAKIEAALKQLNGEATAAVICDLIEEAWPSFVVNRGNWKNVVRATLSNSPKFIARKKREGATRWLLAEDVRSGRLAIEEGDEEGGRTRKKKKRKKGGDDGTRKQKKKRNESNNTDSVGSKRAREEGGGERRTMEGGSVDSDFIGERESKKLKRSKKERKREKEKEKEKQEDGESGSLNKRGRNNVRWADKITDTMAKHGKVGTLSQIYDWFEIEYPEVVAVKPGWKKLISAYLSSGPQFFREGGGTKGTWHLLEK